MRLNAYLARAGVASRRRADELIRAQRVALDPAERESVIHELNNVLREDPVAIYLFSAPSLRAVNE
jgi:16S rRNA U516 pseudouridylate synthase RsuA-like enzyme